ncbi:hypothetical protein [Microscilla marina]|uniref:hypothetical protein n=1 Tax=Microscilla marina TaxID=1027 RepID=UPI0005D476CF|nr:hypothetical protein [Microscilla marina]
MTLYKFRSLVLAAIVLCSTGVTTYAQELSKAEKRAISKEIKGLNRNLEGFRKMLLQEGELDKKIKEKTVEITNKRAEIDKKQKELRDKKIAVQALHDEIKALNKTQKEVNATPQRTTVSSSDTTFKVIIGSYTTKNFSEFANKHKSFVIAPYENPKDNKTYYRYCLGYFTSYWEALYFQKYLAKIMNREGEKYQPYVVGYANDKIIIDVRDLLNKLGL